MAQGTSPVVSPPLINGIVDPDSLSFRLIEANYQYSAKDAINIDFSKKKGIGIVRDGTSQIGEGVTGTEVLGSTIFYKAGTNQTIRMMAVREGSVSKLYYNSGSGWTITSITAGPLNRYRFAVLDDILYLANGTLMKQSSDGISFVDHTAGSNNCLDQNIDDIIARRGRLIAHNGDIHYISGIIQSNGSIDWNALDAGDFQLAPFDGGRSTGYLQIGRYLFLSKTNGMYRLDADSASVEPDNIFGIGAITGEAKAYCQGKGYFWSGEHIYELNENGIAPIDDVLDSIMSKVVNPANVFMGSTEFDIFIYVGQLIIDNTVWDHIVIKFNVIYNSYSFFYYPFEVKYFDRDMNTGELYAVGIYDNEAVMVKLLDNNESTDLGNLMPYHINLQDFIFGSFFTDKILKNKFRAYTKNAFDSSIEISNQEKKLYDFPITENFLIEEFDTSDPMRGKYFTIKWVGTRQTNSLNPEFLEVEFEVSQNEPQPKKGTYKE